jgi:hypothetical protein
MPHDPTDEATDENIDAYRLEYLDYARNQFFRFGSTVVQGATRTVGTAAEERAVSEKKGARKGRHVLSPLQHTVTPERDERSGHRR